MTYSFDATVVFATILCRIGEAQEVSEKSDDTPVQSKLSTTY